MNLEPSLKEKWQGLLTQLSSYPSALVAFSGGVDSSLLAYAAFSVLGDKMLAVTVESGFDTPDQLSQAQQFARRHNIPWIKIRIPLLQYDEITSNPPQRCYFCKKAILTSLHQYAKENHYAVVLEGQNADDLKSHRPGRQAVQETNTISPLLDQQLTKKEIRQIARFYGLSVWEAESSPCLATRIPYNLPITKRALDQVAEAEAFLKSKGFTQVRVRYHYPLARIEVAEPEIEALVKARQEISKAFHDLGFLYVTLDLQGYRSGSMDEGV